MSQVLYCETKETTTPYIFTNTRIAVYSYEEVCYYIYHNPSMVSLEYLGTEFTQWVRECLQMEELANALDQMLEEEEGLIPYLKKLLLAANYFDKNEVALLFERMKAEVSLPKEQKLKRQADGFLDFHKYVRAIRIYDMILQQEDLDREFASTIYHNKGVALSRNFELAPAADCYRRAYEIYPNEVSLSCYLTTFFLLNKFEEAQQEANKLHVELKEFDRIRKEFERTANGYEESEEYQELAKASEEMKYGKEKDAQKRIDTMIQAWKHEYRQQTT